MPRAAHISTTAICRDRIAVDERRFIDMEQHTVSMAAIEDIVEPGSGPAKIARPTPDSPSGPRSPWQVFTHLYPGPRPRFTPARHRASWPIGPCPPGVDMLPRKNETMPRPCAAPPRAPRRTLVVALVAAGAVLGACAQTQPAGADAVPPGMRMERGTGMHHPGMEGRGGMHPGMGGAGMFMGRPEWVARRVDRMLEGIGASDAQRAQIRQIAQAAAADLAAQRDAGLGLRAQGLRIFTAPNVDAAAAESLRQQMLAQHDQASRRMLQAMLDAANVLTPEQRTKLAERNRQRAEQMRNRMREMQDRAPRTPPGNG